MKRKFDVKLRKVGNSFVITIPVDFVSRFEIDEGDFLAVELDSNEIKKIKETKEKASESKRTGEPIKRTGLAGELVSERGKNAR